MCVIIDRELTWSRSSIVELRENQVSDLEAVASSISSVISRVTGGASWMKLVVVVLLPGSEIETEQTCWMDYMLGDGKPISAQTITTLRRGRAGGKE